MTMNQILPECLCNTKNIFFHSSLSGLSDVVFIGRSTYMYPKNQRKIMNH